MSIRECDRTSVESLSEYILSHSYPIEGSHRSRLGIDEVWQLLHQLCPPPERSDETSGWRGWPDLHALPDDMEFVRRYFRAVTLLQQQQRMIVTHWEENSRAIPVEAGIFELALALNRIRHTQSSPSCQGHQYVEHHTHAYAGFVGPFEVALKLVQLAHRHEHFAIRVSSPRRGSQRVHGEIEIHYARSNSPLQSLLDPFIADMEAEGLLTVNIVPMLGPSVHPWRTEEGIFLPSAQVILDDAFQTATQLGHSYVDCEHLLYAVLKQLSPEEGKALPLFEMLHLSPEELVQAVKADLEQLPPEETPSDQRWHHQTELVRDKVELTQPEGHPSLTRDAAEAIRRACMYVPERGQRNVSAYHLAHGICRYLMDESFRSAMYRQHLHWR